MIRTFLITWAVWNVVLLGSWLKVQHGAWRLYLARNTQALMESGRYESVARRRKTYSGLVGMSFGDFLRDPLSRMIYGAQYAEEQESRSL
jgi:hypothetical protein